MTASGYDDTPIIIATHSGDDDDPHYQS